jgi:hypothetical protein
MEKEKAIPGAVYPGPGPGPDPDPVRNLFILWKREACNHVEGKHRGLAKSRITD